MTLQFRPTSILCALAVLVGAALPLSATAGNSAKSWEIDLYDDGNDVTYVDDGYDDLTVYDHREDGYYVDDGQYDGYVEYGADEGFCDDPEDDVVDEDYYDEELPW